MNSSRDARLPSVRPILRWQQQVHDELGNLTKVNPDTIARLIEGFVFWRLAEETNLERKGVLQKWLQQSKCVEEFWNYFYEASLKYPFLDSFVPQNFPFSNQEEKQLKLVFDDCIHALYQPAISNILSSYATEILGLIYENFLITQNSLRKSSGAYYTPKFLVDYVVHQTLKQAFDTHSNTSCSLRILDPACGSGAFLIAIYRVLVARYMSQKCLSKSNIEQKLEILQQHIFGVDLDAHAVQLTKLSLTLEGLKDTNNELSTRDFYTVNQRLFVLLNQNIVCGNSLISSDFKPQKNESDSELQPYLPTLDWKETFCSIFQNGGFDIVIGNPPYISYGGRQVSTIPLSVRNYFDQQYTCSGWPTAHSFFIQRAIACLSKRWVAFVVPDSVGHLEGYADLRKCMLTQGCLTELRYWGDHNFEKVVAPTLTFLFDKQSREKTTIIHSTGKISSRNILPHEIWVSSLSQTLVQKLRKRSFSLRPYLVDCGIRTTHSKSQVVPIDVATGKYVAALEGKQIGRYWCKPPEHAILLKNEHSLFMSKKEKYQNSVFVIRQTASYPIVGPRDHALYFRNSLLGLHSKGLSCDIRYVVGLLNSKLLRFLYTQLIHESSQKVFPQVKLSALGMLPLRAFHSSNRIQQKNYELIVECVDMLLSLNKDLVATSYSSQTLSLKQKQINHYDAMIDQAVYAMYELSDREIESVEESLGFIS